MKSPPPRRIAIGSVDLEQLPRLVRDEGYILLDNDALDLGAFDRVLDVLGGLEPGAASRQIEELNSGLWDGGVSPMRQWAYHNRPAVTVPRRQLKKSQIWHLDESWVPLPPNFVALMCIEPPNEGGQTDFVDLRLVLSSMSDWEKREVDGCEACFSFKSGEDRLGTDWAPKPHADFEPVWHPVVRYQPVTKVPTLFVNLLAEGGWRRRETKAPAPDVCELATHALERVVPYVHEWRAGETLIFDNSVMLHRRSLNAVSGRRCMRQVRLARAPVERASLFA